MSAPIPEWRHALLMEQFGITTPEWKPDVQRAPVAALLDVLKESDEAETTRHLRSA